MVASVVSKELQALAGTWNKVRKLDRLVLQLLQQSLPGERPGQIA